MPAFRVDLIDVPLVIRRGRDIEFCSWTGVTLEGPIVLRMSCRRVCRRRGTTRRPYGRFRSRIESNALLRDVHVFQVFRGFLKEIDFYLSFKPFVRTGNTKNIRFVKFFISDISLFLHNL